MAFMFLWDDELLSQEGEPSKLPRDHWTPDFSQQIQEALNEGRHPGEILLCTCPHCGSVSYYSGGFTCWCEWCGKLMVSPDSEDETLTLEDYWFGEDDSEG